MFKQFKLWTILKYFWSQVLQVKNPSSCMKTEKKVVEESSLWSNHFSSHLPPPHEPRQTEWQPTRLNISTSHYEKEASLRQSPQLAFRIQSALLHTKIILLLNLGAFQGIRTTHLARGNLSQEGCIVNRHRTSWGRRHTNGGVAWLVTLCLLPGSTEGREAGYEISRPTYSAHLLR